MTCTNIASLLDVVVPGTALPTDSTTVRRPGRSVRRTEAELGPICILCPIRLHDHPRPLRSDRAYWSVPRVLLIEDDPAIRTGLGLALRRQGHAVDTAATGEEGLVRLRAGG